MKTDILLRAKYDINYPNLDQFIVVIKDRFLEKKEIDGSNIKDVKKGYFILNNNTHIPSHRIIEIKKKS